MISTSLSFKNLERYKNQILATLAVNIIAFSQGHAVAWLAPTLLVLQSENSPLVSGPVTVEEASWIGSVVSVGGITGTVLFGTLLNVIGRKKSLYLLTIPHTGFWLILMFGTAVPHLYIARILSGITGGGAFIVIPTFVADIADNKIRGTLGSTILVNFNAGILSGFILASHLSYSLFPRIIIGFSIIYIITIYSLPEAPQYLIKIKMHEEAECALRFYRNFKAATKEECQEFNENLANLKNRINGDLDSKPSSLSYRDFLKPAAVRGLLISMMLVFMNQASGLFALVNYTSNIFQMSGSSLDPNTSTIIVGAIQLMGTFFAATFVDRVGRRILIITSCLGVAVGCFSLSIFSYLSLNQDLTHLSWIAVASVSFSILLGSFGLTPLPFIVVTEIMPQKVRPVAVTFCLCILSVTGFTVLKIYPILMVDLGLYGVMWISGGICLIGAVVMLCFLPETKGKNLDIKEDS